MMEEVLIKLNFIEKKKRENLSSTQISPPLPHASSSKSVRACDCHAEAVASEPT